MLPLADLVLLAINDLWYALPLVVAVSLVYSATRHEAVQQILESAIRIGVWICGFMVAVFAVLFLVLSII